MVALAPGDPLGNISALVALDFLGFGLPPPPSWGKLIAQGLTHLRSWWLVVFPLGALVVTLVTIAAAGETARRTSARDPVVGLSDAVHGRHAATSTSDPAGPARRFHPG